jgi:hypothetical protein
MPLFLELARLAHEKSDKLQHITLSINRQKGLTTTHVHKQLDRFASQRTILFYLPSTVTRGRFHETNLENQHGG